MIFKKPVLVAEVGCNHKGDVEIAKNMIAVAADCGADIVKFQKRDPKECLTKAEYKSPHPVPENSYGSSYGEHREYLELSIDEHLTLKQTCEKHNVEYSVSVWDFESLREILLCVNPKHIKIPSAHATNLDLIKAAYSSSKATIHISLGMTTEEERYNIVFSIEEFNPSNKTILYHCTSGYPVEFSDANLLNIKDIYSYEGGYSGHHLGIAIDIAAYTLGATYIERHFTLDRTWKGTDHAASLEPQGLRKLKRNLEATYEALTYRPEGLLDIEKPQARKLRWDRQLKDFD